VRLSKRRSGGSFRKIESGAYGVRKTWPG